MSVPLLNYISSFIFPSFPTPPTPRPHLEVCNRILTRLHPRSHIPILHQTRPDHPPNTGNVALAKRNAVTSEVDGAEGGAGQVGADENALDVNGAAFELGALEGDYDCDAVLWRGGVCQLAGISLSKRIKKEATGATGNVWEGSCDRPMGR